MTSFVYTNDYVEKLFQYWVQNGCPSARKLHDAIEKDESLRDEYGRIPGAQTLDNWFWEKDFFARRDLIDARVATKIDDELVSLKVNALREQAALFRDVRRKAAKHLMETDFDSSSAAVNAFIKASQEERIALGISRTIQKMAELDDDGLLQKVKELSARVSGEVLDADEVTDGEESDE